MAWTSDIDEYKFLSTPSARRATNDCDYQRSVPYISIHALREEGDMRSNPPKSMNAKFLSTPSARRATLHVHILRGGLFISIHALREEGDPGVFVQCAVQL